MTASDGRADLVLTGGKIRSPAHPSGFVQALAVRGGLISSAGTDEEIRQVTGPRTRVVDLGGRLVIPAFGDAHVHAVAGGLESLRCNLAGLPGISVPAGLTQTGLPLGLQLIGKAFDEATLLRAAQAVEAAADFKAKPANWWSV